MKTSSQQPSPGKNDSQDQKKLLLAFTTQKTFLKQRKIVIDSSFAVTATTS